MKRLALALVVALSVNAAAADHQWQHGIWRDIQHATTNGGAISIPVGGSPPTTVAGVPMGGTAPTYFSIPLIGEMERITIDGPNSLRYVAEWQRKFVDVIINDPVDFAVEGKYLYVKSKTPGKADKLAIVSTIRLPD